MVEKRCVQGRWIDDSDVAWLRQWIQANPQWSRKGIARALCEQWSWRDQRGRLKDFAARTFLLKLEAGGEIELPPLQENKRRRPKGVVHPPSWEEPSLRECQLTGVKPVQVEPVAPRSRAAQRWAFYLDRYHYLGLRVVGENLGYLVTDAQGRDTACLLFGAPAWRCAGRDRFLGWTDEERQSSLHRVSNNTRLLILPWVRIPHLASHVLGQVARRISGDWQSKYGHGLDWLETFVETGRFRGSCYQAANWQCVGRTTGRTRQDRDHQIQTAPKAVYLYRLRR